VLIAKASTDGHTGTWSVAVVKMNDLHSVACATRLCNKHRPSNFQSIANVVIHQNHNSCNEDKGNHPTSTTLIDFEGLSKHLIPLCDVVRCCDGILIHFLYLFCLHIRHESKVQKAAKVAKSCQSKRKKQIMQPCLGTPVIRSPLKTSD
jgi:hypothetical protein